jgi:hypothetical protein
MRPSRGMGCINEKKIPGSKPKVVGRKHAPQYAKGGAVKKRAGSGDSKVNQANNYTKPSKRKSLFEGIKNSAVQGTAAGQWSARKAQLLAKRYKAAGGGYK